MCPSPTNPPISHTDIKWLGVRPSDLDRFNIPQQCRLAMTEEDIKTGKKLVSGCQAERGFVQF